MHQHHKNDVKSARCLILAVSDTRTIETDEAGKFIVEALENTQQVELPSTAATADSIYSPFFFKRIISRKAEIPISEVWNKFLLSMTPSIINCAPFPYRREAKKGEFTLRMVPQEEDILRWQVTERADVTPMYTLAEKDGFSKIITLSYANPSVGFEPPVYQSKLESLGLKKTLYNVGVRWNIHDVLINRIMIYKYGTNSRPFDYGTQMEAEIFLQELYDNDIIFNSLETLESSGKNNKINEVLGRVRKIAAIQIYQNDLLSRLLAQLGARLLEKRELEQREENGSNEEFYINIPIEFYIPGDPLNHHHYTKDQQLADQVLGVASSSDLCKEVLGRISNYQRSLLLQKKITYRLSIKYQQEVHWKDWNLI